MKHIVTAFETALHTAIFPPNGVISTLALFFNSNSTMAFSCFGTARCNTLGPPGGFFSTLAALEKNEKNLLQW